MQRKNDFDHLSYVSETQTLVGSKQRQLQDLDSGEIIHVEQITKRVYGQKAFWKVYLMDFLQILGILDSRQLDILVYILERTEASNNTFIGTYKKIEADIGVSSKTISKVMNKLQEKKFIKRVQNGVWQISPNIMMKGSDHKKQLLLSYFDDNESEPNKEGAKDEVRTEPDTEREAS